MPDESVRTHYDALEIIYTSKSQSADEYILSALAEKLNCSKEVVITSDNQLALCCKMLNAQTLTIEAFLSSLTSKHRKKKKKTATVELQKSFQDTKGNISRLLKIFEERSKNPEDN